MGLSKSSGSARQVVESRANDTVEKNEIRSQLIDIYRAKVGSVKLDTLNPKELLESFDSREALAAHLAEEGKEMESNHLRKETIHAFVKKAEELEAVAFASMKALSDAKNDSESGPRAVLKKEYTDLHKKIAEVSSVIEQKKLELASLQKDSEEYAALEAGIKDMSKDANEKMIPRYAELRQLFSSFGAQDKTNTDLASSTASQALSLKKAAAVIMVEMGNYDSAFELVLESVGKYFNSSIAGAEELMGWLVATTENMAKSAEGTSSKHKLMELAFEGCIDTAAQIEAAVFDSKANSSNLESALWFRTKATMFSKELGHSREEMLAPLLEAANVYKEHGYDTERANLLEFALQIDVSFRALFDSVRRGGGDDKPPMTGQYL